MPAGGYLTKTEAIDHVREATGYGRRVIERKMNELEESGVIRFIPDPGHLQARIIHIRDVEKVVAALTPPPPPE